MGYSACAFSVVSLCSQVCAHIDIMFLRSEDVLAVDVEPRNPHVERHWHRHHVTEAIEASRQMAKQGKLMEARDRLTVEFAALSRSPLVAQGDALCTGLLSHVKECIEHMEEERTYHDTGSKTMASIQRMHEQ